MLTVTDVENTFSESGNLPYWNNYLVSIGFGNVDTMEQSYFCCQHDTQPKTPNTFKRVQAILDATTLLIGHNLKHDLQWINAIWEYQGAVYDTMTYEYLKYNGMPQMYRLSLKECCARRKLPAKKDVTEEYLSKGIGFNAMPWEVVEEYGNHDVYITMLLYIEQQKELGLWKE